MGMGWDGSLYLCLPCRPDHRPVSERAGRVCQPPGHGDGVGWDGSLYLCPAGQKVVGWCFRDTHPLIPSTSWHHRHHHHHFRYCMDNPVTRTKLQLVGVTALLVRSELNEGRPTTTSPSLSMHACTLDPMNGKNHPSTKVLCARTPVGFRLTETLTPPPPSPPSFDWPATTHNRSPASTRRSTRPR